MCTSADKGQVRYHVSLMLRRELLEGRKQMDSAGLNTLSLVTAKELAKALQVGRSTVYRWANEGRIPAVQISRTVRFDLQAVRRTLGLDGEVVPAVELVGAQR